MKRVAFLLLLCVCFFPGCKKGDSAQQAAESGKLAQQLLGKWKDQSDGSLAWEFLEDGKCKAFGDMECKYEIRSEAGPVLLLKYNAVDSWDEVEVTFKDADSATWKNVTTAKTDPEASTTKIARLKE